MPDVSVLTASFNAEPKHLIEAYRSLADENGDVDWEWLIQVDGCTGEIPAEVTRDPRVQVARNGRHLGAAATRNMALTRAASPLVQNLDSDDCLLTGTLAALSDALRAHADAVLAFGREV